MNIEKLFPKETSVKLSVVKIDTKKLTKSIYNQLHLKSPFDKLYNLKENVSFLGYVNDKGRFMLWSDEESLYKYDIDKLYLFRFIDLDKNKISELVKIYPSEEVENLNSHRNENGILECDHLEISCVLDKKYQYEIIDKRENVNKIVSELYKRQIFL